MKYEAAEDDEENTYDLKITREMELDDVVQKIVARLNQFWIQTCFLTSTFLFYHQTQRFTFRGLH